MMSLFNWPAGRYAPGFHIGSEGENGEHRRDATGWPFTIYRQAAEIGVTDHCLCEGIQDRADAERILNLVNAAETNPVVREAAGANLYATDGKCHNAQTGTYGHECGKPAKFVGTNRQGFRMGFCASCKESGSEARNVATWEPVR